MDSIAITYALLGPFMAVVRAAGAVVTAITTGLLVAVAEVNAIPMGDQGESSCSDRCCSSACASETPGPAIGTASLSQRLRDGMTFAFGDLLDDISTWILLGLIVAGLLMAFTSPATMATYGSGVLPMLLMAVIGIPLYICATAATPIAAGLLLAGTSTGTALVFLLAGPITSTATLAILRREMGDAALIMLVAAAVRPIRRNIGRLIPA